MQIVMESSASTAGASVLTSKDCDLYSKAAVVELRRVVSAMFGKRARIDYSTKTATHTEGEGFKRTTWTIRAVA
jgi:hypothetical protein